MIRSKSEVANQETRSTAANSPNVLISTARALLTAIAFLLPLALLLSLTAVLLFLVLEAPPRWRLDAGTSGDTRFLYGFSIPEVEAGGNTTFRWSGPESRLMLHGANARPFALQMRLYHQRLTPDDDKQHLSLERDGQSFAALEVGDGWRVYRFLPREGASGTGVEAAHLDMISATYRPGPRDGRDLGMVVDWIEVVPLTIRSGFFVATVPLQRTLLLTWGLAILAGALWRGDRALLGRSTPRRVTVRVCVLVGIVAAGLVVWAQRNPYTLAWAVPAMPWILGLATLMVVGSQGVAAGAAVITAAHARLRIAALPTSVVWLGLGLLVIAQTLLTTQWAVGAGIALAIGSLLLLVCADQAWHAPAELWSGERSVLRVDQRQGKREMLPVLLLALILLVALGLRFYRITDLPFGLWRDEARHGLIALRILEEPDYHPIYVASNRVNMPALGFYPFALAMKLWGVHDWSMRTVTALAGALTVLPLYALIVRLSGRRSVALLAAALLAVSSWHLTISRFSFPTILEPLFGLTGLWLLVVGLTRDQPAREGEPRDGYTSDVRMQPTLLIAACLLLAGICMGIAVQMYHTGRMVPVVGLGLALLLLWRYPQSWRRWIARMLVVGLGLALTVGPLVAYALSRPEAFNDRVGRVFILNEGALQGSAPLAALDEALGRHLLMFNVRGDENGRHHAPGQPMLDFVTGLGFLVGCAFLLRSGRDWRSLFLLGALGISLVPSALAVNGPHAMRSIGAVVFACTIAALGWVQAWRLLDTRSQMRNEGYPAGWRGVRVAPFIIVLLALVLNFRTYFVAMAVDSQVWGASYPVHTQVGRYVRDQVDKQGSQALDQLYVPENLARNSVFTYMVYGLPVKTFNSTSLPRLARPGALFVLSGYTYREDEPRLMPYLGPAATPALRGPDFPGRDNPAFVVYRVP